MRPAPCPPPQPRAWSRWWARRKGAFAHRTNSVLDTSALARGNHCDEYVSASAPGFCFHRSSDHLHLTQPRPTERSGRRARPGRRRFRRARSAIPQADGAVSHHRAARHDHHRHRRTASLSRAGQRTCHPLWHRGRPRRLSVAGAVEYFAQGGMAGLDAPAGNDRTPALSAALHGRRSRQPARCARALSRRHGVPHPRHQPPGHDRYRGLVGMFPAGQCRRQRPLRSRTRRHQGHQAAEASAIVRGPSKKFSRSSGETHPMRSFRSGLLIGIAIAVAVGAVAIVYQRYDTNTLKRTMRRDAVLCGVNTGLPGFSTPDDKGNWSGFDVDFCRAVAAAIFDNPDKVKFVALDASERFKELQNRKVDILSRNSTWSMSRETGYDLYFPAVAYYDGQGFMVPSSRKVDSGLALDGSKVCVQDATTSQLNLSDYFRTNNMKYQEEKFSKL